MDTVADLSVAQELVRQVRASGRPRTWRRMTTILSAYGVYRLTDSVRDRIQVAFTAAGLSTEPSLEKVERTGSVRLWLADSDKAPGQHVHSSSGLPKGVSVWQRHDATWTTRPPADRDGTLTFVDVDVSLVHDPGYVAAFLLEKLPGLDKSTLDDLLDQDTQASFRRRRTSTSRRASLFVATTDEGPEESHQKAVLLTRGLVEFAVGGSWVVIVRYPPVTYVGGSPSGNDPSTPSAKVYMNSLIEHGLPEAVCPADLALVVIHHAVYSLGQAKAELDSSLELWRTASRRVIPDHAVPVPDKTLLVDLQATLPLILHALAPLQHPTVKDFMGLDRRAEAGEVRDQVDRDVDALRNLQTNLAAALAQADQAQNEADQNRIEKHQASLATLAGVLLAPALIASIFGANQMLSDSPLDLLWLFLAMVVAGFVTWVAITRRLKRDREPTSPLPPAVETSNRNT
jgi:hypothetical protein